VGLAIPAHLGSSWWARLLAGEIEVVQRESGASVQQTFEEATGGTGIVPGPRLGGHLAAARYGAAVGLPALTIEPAARAIGSDFHPLGRHEAELWVGKQWVDDRGVEDLLDLISSSQFRRRLEAVGGYELDDVGRRVA
jgi:putative molybdopterin biosynthesis protein